MRQPPKGYEKADLNDKQLADLSRVANFVFLMHFDQLQPSYDGTGEHVDMLSYVLTFTAEQVPDTTGGKQDYWCEVTFYTFKNLGSTEFSFANFHVWKDPTKVTIC